MSNTRSDSIRVAGIENDSITDGPGLRFSLFVQGCPRTCSGCHNPEAIPLEGGQEYTVENLIGLIRRNPLLTGVTFSGGEPLLQAAALVPLATLIREEGLDLAIYTGFTWEEILRQNNPDVLALISFADILIDGPFLMQKRNLALRFRGSENQRILNVSQSLAAGKATWTEDEDWTGHSAIPARKQTT